MRYLMDTHTLIWWWDERERLPARVLDLVSDPRNSVFVSAASGWEMAIKVAKGQLPQMQGKLASFDESVTDDDFAHLPIDHRHGICAAGLPGTHRDPFDRVLAAQSLLDDMTLLTRDRAISGFGCRVLW